MGSKKRKASPAPSKRHGAKHQRRKPKQKKSKRGKIAARGYCNPFVLFCNERRAEVIRQRGLEAQGTGFETVGQAMGEAWRALSEEEQQGYKALSQVQRLQQVLKGLHGVGRDLSQATSIGDAVKEAVKSLSRLPLARRSHDIMEPMVAALEDLDKALSQAVRGVIASSLGDRVGAADAAPRLQQAPPQGLGEHLGGRLVALFRRWQASGKKPSEAAKAPAQKPSEAAKAPAQKPSEAAKAPAQKPSEAAKAPAPTPSEAAKARALEPSEAAQATSSSQPPPSPGSQDVDQALRSKVVGLLMRVKGGGKLPIPLCQRIEESLFDFVGSQTKDYRTRAQNLFFNLRPDRNAKLFEQVEKGLCPPEMLVRLSNEELASEELRAARNQEREHYFRHEVLSNNAPLPKRQREGRFEGSFAEEEEKPQPRARQSAGGGQAEEDAEKVQEPGARFSRHATDESLWAQRAAGAIISSSMSAKRRSSAMAEAEAETEEMEVLGTEETPDMEEEEDADDADVDAFFAKVAKQQGKSSSSSSSSSTSSSSSSEVDELDMLS